MGLMEASFKIANRFIVIIEVFSEFILTDYFYYIYSSIILVVLLFYTHLLMVYP